MSKIIIIGAGFGGLAAAALLGKDGHEVVVLEKNDQAGGRGMVYEKDGFVFDMGPSWYLMPDVFERFFSIFDKTPSDFYKLQRLDPSYKIFFDKNDSVTIHKDIEKNYETFEKLEPGSTKVFKKFLKTSGENYRMIMESFVYKNFTKITDFLDLRLVFKARKLHIFQSFDKYMSKLFKSAKLRQILQYSVVFLGGSPKNTPALFSIMSHIDFSMGVWYPMGGMSQITKALISLGNQYNVSFQYNSPVEKIVIEDGKAKGVIVNGELIGADIVISNADYHFTEINLIEEKYRSVSQKKWDKMIIAPSAFIIYLGIKGELKNIEHHTLSFAHNWEEHFDDIFRQKKNWPDKPTFYICCPSKTDKSVALKDHENLFVLVPIAPGLTDTPEFREEYSQKILTELEDLIGEKIKDRIVLQKIHTINDYKELYNAYQGTALGLAHNLKQSGPFRLSNKSKKVSNLYYVGQFTTPGVGVPMCLISAQLVVKRVQSEQK